MSCSCKIFFPSATSNVKSAIETSDGTIEFENKKGDLTLTDTSAINVNSHAEGYNTETGGDYTSNTKTAGTETTSGVYAHAEGNSTIANGIGAHSEGGLTLAKGNYSHTEGSFTNTNGNNSHAEGRNTKTLCNAEHAQGSYNVSHSVTTSFNGNSGNTLHSIGIGTADNARQNAVEVMQNGDVYIKGVGSYAGTDTKVQNTGIKTLQDVITSLYWELNRVKVLAPNQIRYTVKDGIRFSPFDALHRIDSEEFNSNLGVGIINYGDGLIETGEFEFSAYAGQNTITSIELPKSDKLDTISVRSFRGQDYLTQFTIPLNILRIDDEAFMDCGRLEIVKYEGTKQMWGNIRLGAGVFANTMVSAIYCIDGVVNI